jgi:hypothetical protein
MSVQKLRQLYRSCDALLHLQGGTDFRNDHLALTAPFRVLIQTDPVGSELRIANGNEKMRVAYADHHHVIATYGENYGAPDCGVPLNGLEAKFCKTRQPIDLGFWPMSYDSNARLFTTIGNYRQKAKYEVSYNGEVYRWSKHHEWEKFLDLPRLTEQPFELAVMIEQQTDGERLQAHGWQLTSPFQMSLDIFGDYPAYIRRSRAEFTVAKDQNIRLRSGWFSDRDACYLASGKPVIAQDTGFSNVLPTGEGLFAFTTMDEALAAIDAINSDYRRHCEAAQMIAEEYFEARSVAARLLTDISLA